MNDAIIECAMNYIWQIYASEDKKDSDYHVFGPNFNKFFIQYVKKKEPCYRPSRVRRMAFQRFKGKPAVACSTLLFLCNVNRNHWQLVIVYPLDKEIEMMDPLKQDD